MEHLRLKIWEFPNIRGTLKYLISGSLTLGPKIETVTETLNPKTGTLSMKTNYGGRNDWKRGLELQP